MIVHLSSPVFFGTQTLRSILITRSISKMEGEGVSRGFLTEAIVLSSAEKSPRVSIRGFVLRDLR